MNFETSIERYGAGFGLFVCCLFVCFYVVLRCTEACNVFTLYSRLLLVKTTAEVGKKKNSKGQDAYLYFDTKLNNRGRSTIKNHRQFTVSERENSNFVQFCSILM